MAPTIRSRTTRTREGAAKNRRVEIEVKVTNSTVETNTIDTAIQD